MYRSMITRSTTTKVPGWPSLCRENPPYGMSMEGIEQSVRGSTRKGEVFVTWAAEDQDLPDEAAAAVATGQKDKENKLPFFLDPSTR